MRQPSSTLIVDAAILIAAARGRSSRAMTSVARFAVLATTDRAIEEARRRIELGMKRPELLEILDTLAELLMVVPVAALQLALSDAEEALRLAPASANGSTQDAHLLALAWEIEADIWTTDRDFAGAGVASWSTANLIHALAA